MAPQTTLWNLEGHTVGKHRVLESYLEAWLPIILMSFDRATFVDGFAGPGEYSGGEPGSPMIAIDTLRKHKASPRMAGSLDFIFIEKDIERAGYLNQVLGRSPLPPGCNAKVYAGEFTDRMPELLDALESQGRQDKPMFVMIDPFGVKQTPMDVIRGILQNERSEVYISVMYRDINRFNTTSAFSEGLDGLFGTTDWKQAWEIDDSTKRRDFLYGLYKSQLKKAGANYVHHFDLYRGNELVYALFFATKSNLGSDRMKQAMWKVAPFGDFAFRSSARDQMTLGFEVSLSQDNLSRALVAEFGLNNQVSIEEIEEFMRSDRTTFHSGQLRDCLAKMEERQTIAIDPESRQRRKSFPPDTRLMFVEPPPPEPEQGALFRI